MTDDNDKMFLLYDGISRRLYIPNGTNKTNGNAASIILNAERKAEIIIGQDAASEKAVRGEESAYAVSREYLLPDDISALIKRKASVESLENKMQDNICKYFRVHAFDKE